MSDITREEMAARFAASDARASAHEARVEGRFTGIEGRMVRLEERLDLSISETRQFRTEIVAENRTTRLTIVVTLVASLIAFAGAMWTAQANLLAAFQAGLAKQAAATSPAAAPAAPTPTAPAKPERKASLADAR